MEKEISGYKFFKRLQSFPFVEKIILFGSRAKGVYESRADIDLAIVCPTASTLEWDLVLKVIEDADTMLKIDCIRWDVITSEKLRNAIKENHIVLYERSLNDL